MKWLEWLSFFIEIWFGWIWKCLLNFSGLSRVLQIVKFIWESREKKEKEKKQAEPAVQRGGPAHQAAQPSSTAR